MQKIQKMQKMQKMQKCKNAKKCIYNKANIDKANTFPTMRMKCIFCGISCYGTCDEWSDMQIVVNDFSEMLQNEFFIDSSNYTATGSKKKRPKRTNGKHKRPSQRKHKCKKCRTDRKVCVTCEEDTTMCERCMNLKKDACVFDTR